jgi:cytochrome P450
MTQHAVSLRGPLPPGQQGLPLLGETIPYLRDPQFVAVRQARYGNIFSTHLFGHPTVIMVGAEANKFVLSQGMSHFSWGQGWPATIKRLFPCSLIMQDGEEHQRNRQIIAPAFHGRALTGYWETMLRLTDKYLAKWGEKFSFVWLEEFKRLTFEIASELLLGSVAGAETDRLSKLYTDLIHGTLTLPLDWPGTPFRRALQAREHLLSHLEHAVERRRAEPSTDVLSMLVQAQDAEGQGLSTEEIKSQALLLVLAGHETTSSLLTSLCLALAQHPEVWDKARAEQAGLPAELTMEQLRAMPYLDQVLHEVERLWPPTSVGFRAVVEPFEFGGYVVPAGWRACFRIIETHLDPAIFSDPSLFDPDRFSPERNEHKKQAFSLVGFGGGPRICVGMSFALMEAKIVAAQLLRNWTWDVLPSQDLSYSVIPSLHPRDGLRVAFRRRAAA